MPVQILSTPEVLAGKPEASTYCAWFDSSSDLARLRQLGDVFGSKYQNRNRRSQPKYVCGFSVNDTK
jgi:hypothetical protein